MVAHEDKYKGVQYGKYDTAEELQRALNKYINKNNDEVIFVCIGTDRSTGDSLAPFVGTMLKERGYTNVYGTIDNPIHAENLDDKISILPEGKTIIAIDAALGKYENIGKLCLNKGKLYPGKGVNRDLTPIGDYHISGIVNVDASSPSMSIRVLMNTRLKLVLHMAKEITKAIEESFPLQAIETFELVKAQ